MNEGPITSSSLTTAAAFLSEDVDQNTNIRDLLAFGLYAKARSEWEAEFIRKNGAAPSFSELSQFDSVWTASMIDNLKHSSSTALNAYTSVFLQSAMAEFYENEQRNLIRLRRAVYAMVFAMFVLVILTLVTRFELFVDGISAIFRITRVSNGV
jgi:hypothetical protein